MTKSVGSELRHKASERNETSDGQRRLQEGLGQGGAY